MCGAGDVDFQEFHLKWGLSKPVKGPGFALAEKKIFLPPKMVKYRTESGFSAEIMG